MKKGRGKKKNDDWEGEKEQKIDWEEDGEEIDWERRIKGIEGRV